MAGGPAKTTSRPIALSQPIRWPTATLALTCIALEALGIQPFQIALPWGTGRAVAFGLERIPLNPSETVQVFQDLGARRIMILHWGAFRLGDEPVFDPPFQLEAGLRESGLLECWIGTTHGETNFVSRNGSL